LFRQLGESPKAEECVGFVGLKNEHDKLLGEVTRELVDSLDTGAAARTEHYEIAAYQGLIAMARGLGNSAVVPLLQENLLQEREALRELEKVSRRLAKQQRDSGSTRRVRTSTGTSRATRMVSFSTSPIALPETLRRAEHDSDCGTRDHYPNTTARRERCRPGPGCCSSSCSSSSCSAALATRAADPRTTAG
jgi:hypothetical protein